MLSWVRWRWRHEEEQQQQQNVFSDSTKYLIEHVPLLPLQGCSKRQAPLPSSLAKPLVLSIVF
jgi:hypothetical protein